MSLPQLVSRRTRILTEGSVYELLRRSPGVAFDAAVAHAGLIYDPGTRSVLEDVHRQYLEIGRRRRLPMLLFTDTWRASGERIARSAFRGREVNADNVRFLREVAGDAAAFIAGMSGPRGDAYRSDEAPDRAVAIAVHRPQIEELARAGVDLLFAATLPALEEALGIGEVMAATGIPWSLSFVVRLDGTLLDGSSLAVAIGRLDGEVRPRALGFSINCVHPTIARRVLDQLPCDLAARMIAFQGNTSRLSPEELDGQDDMQTEDPALFATCMGEVAADIPIVGGCCGTDVRHLAAVADQLTGQAAVSSGR